MNILDLASKKVNLKKAASTHGGEWHGPCPACGGKDRFHVWPHQNEGKGGYWCRACGKAGDNIQFLIDFEGMNYKDACAYLNISKPDYRPGQSAPAKPAFTPQQHQNPAELWQAKAEKFVTWAQENLKHNKNVLDWLSARGINAWTAEYYRLGWNPGENGKDIFRARKAWGLPELFKENGKSRMLWIPQGLVIPYSIDGIIQRIRVRRPEGEPRYYVVPGSSMSTMIIGIERRAFVIVESEVDAIACAAATDLAGAAGLGSVSTKPDAAAFEILKNSLQILNALDYDRAGARAYAWWEEQFPERCDRWPVPQGKDPGEAYAMGIDLGQWIEAGLPPVVTIGKRNEGKGEREKEQGQRNKEENKNSVIFTPKDIAAMVSAKGLSPLLAELWNLLRNNPGVKIINRPDRFTIVRNGKYVHGRINELVFREYDVTAYIISNPAEEINWQNLLMMEG